MIEKRIGDYRLMYMASYLHINRFIKQETEH